MSDTEPNELRCETCGKKLIYVDTPDTNNGFWSCPNPCTPKYVLEYLDSINPEDFLDPVWDELQPSDTISNDEDEYFFDYGEIFDDEYYSSFESFQLPQVDWEAESLNHFLYLKAKYCIEPYDKNFPLSKLVPILIKLDRNLIPDENEIKWLLANNVFSLAALIYLRKFETDRFLWNLIKAKKFFRLAGLLNASLSLVINFIPADMKILSALNVVHGAALRAVSMLTEAEKCAQAAIKSDNTNFYAYNLLGAIYFQMRQYGQGLYYYQLAINYGSDTKRHERVIDQDMQNDLLIKQEVAAFLLKEDPVRYSWVRKYLPS